MLDGDFALAVGPNDRPKTGDCQMDNAFDVLAAPGTPVLAVGDGEVDEEGIGYRSNGQETWGHRLILRLGDGNRIAYRNLGGFALGVYPGAKVTRGSILGWVGLWAANPAMSHLTISSESGEIMPYLETD